MRHAQSCFTGDPPPRQAAPPRCTPAPQARRVLLLAFGENKAGIVSEAVEGPVSDKVAASFLQQHPSARVLLDYAAAAGAVG